MPALTADPGGLASDLAGAHIEIGRAREVLRRIVKTLANDPRSRSAELAAVRSALSAVDGASARVLDASRALAAAPRERSTRKVVPLRSSRRRR